MTALRDRARLALNRRIWVAVEDEGEVDEAVPGPEVGDVSATRFSFGAVAAKSRWSRSRARSSAASSGIVVRCFLPRRTPSSPSWRISRATRSRPITTSRRLSSFQVFAHPVDAGVARAVGVDLGHELPVLERAAGRLPGSVRVMHAHRHDRPTDRLDPKASRRSSM